MLATILAILIAAIVPGYGTWFLLEFIRYVHSGEYAVDKRIREITQ